jgi:homoserine dehydrogenase
MSGRIEQAQATLAEAVQAQAAVAEAAPPVVRIALAGCGAVGGAVYQRLAGSDADRALATQLARTHGVRLEIERVLVRAAGRVRVGAPPARLLVTRPAELASPDTHVVIEALGGIEPALGLARATLRAGRAYITANKTLIAAHGPELARLAAEYGGCIGFEAAVGGGMPIVRLLGSGLAASGVQRVRGVLNGTTNFILDRMAGGASFAQALRAAQTAGFAEADATRDLDGTDAAEKIAILAWIAFGAAPAQVAVRARGILPDPDRLVHEAAAGGGVVRLVAQATRTAAGVEASVAPEVVAPDSPFARARAEYNVVVIDTAAAGQIRLAGPGAGGAATASALLADVVEHVRALRARGGCGV